MRRNLYSVGLALGVVAVTAASPGWAQITISDTSGVSGSVSNSQIDTAAGGAEFINDNGPITITAAAGDVRISNTNAAVQNGAAIVFNNATPVSNTLDTVTLLGTGTISITSSAGPSATLNINTSSVQTDGAVPANYGIYITNNVDVTKAGTGAGAAIALEGGAAASIWNSGTVTLSTTAVNSPAVISATSANLILTNAGTISSNVDGADSIIVTGAGSSVSLTNIGSIINSNAGETVLNFGNAVTVTNLVNTGTISASSFGDVAIDLRGDTASTTVTTSGGSIYGMILLGDTSVDTLNVSGTTLTGGIAGGDAGFNMNVTADTTLGTAAGASITALNTLTVSNGASFDVANYNITNTDSSLALAGTGEVDITGITGSAISVGTGTLSIASGVSLTSDNAALVGAGTITNAGTVNGVLVVSATNTNNGTTINNQDTGLIEELLIGGNGAGFSYTVVNAGEIVVTGTPANNAAVAGANGVSITSFTNTGTISVGVDGDIAVDFGSGNIGYLGAFTNSGNISAQDNADIAVDVSGDTNATLLTFSGGTVTGSVVLGGAASDTLRITNAAVVINGDIVGNGTAGGILDVDANFNYTTGAGNVIQDITLIDIAMGTTLTVGANNSIGTVTNTNDLTVRGGTLDIDAVTGVAINTTGATNGLTLSGTTLVTDASAIIAGNMTIQSSTVSGTLAISDTELNLLTGTNIGDIAGSAIGTEVLNIRAAFSSAGTISNVDTLNISNTSTIDHAITGLNGGLTISGTGVEFFVRNGSVSGSGVLTLGTGSTLDVSSNTLYLGSAVATGVSSTVQMVATSTTTGGLVLQSGGGDFSNTTFEFTSISSKIADGTTRTVVNGATGSTVVSGTVSESYVVYSIALSVDQTTDDMIATFTRNGFDDLATNAQNLALGGALESIVTTATGELETVIENLTILNNRAAIDDALETLQPAIDGVAQASIDLQTSAMNTVSDRLANLRGYGVSGVATGNGMYADHMWLQAFGSVVDQSEKDGISGYQATGFGFATGVDSDDWFAGGTTGVALAYGLSNIEGDSAANAETDVVSYQLTGYYSADLQDGLYVDTMLSAAYNDYESERTVDVGSFDRKVEAEYSGWQGSARAAVGKRFAMAGNLTLIPEASLQYTHLDVESYTETGAGGASLYVTPDNSDALVLGLGGAANWDFEQASGAVLRGELRAVYTYDFIGDEFSATSNFVGATNTTFKTEGAEAEQHGIKLGAGAKLLDLSGAEFGVDYDATLKADYVAHQGVLKVRFPF